MQGIILAAGKGTRLYPLTKNVPKVMLKIHGKPLLEHQVNLFKKYNINDIYINVFTMPNKIIDYFKDGSEYGVHITYLREDTPLSYKGPKLLGSAGAIHNLKKYLKEDFLVLYGDVYTKINIEKLVNFHKHKRSPFTLVAHASKHPKDSDLIEINDDQRITRWIRKPHNRASGMSNAGLYLINKDVIQYLPKKVPCDFGHDLLPKLIKEIPVYTYITNETLIDIGTLERYNTLHKRI